MTHAPTRTCPDPETLAAFAEGRLSAADAAAVVAHLDTCDDCTRDAALGMQAAEEEEDANADERAPANVVRPRRWMPWVAAAAAAILLVLLLPAIREAVQPRGIDRLVGLAPRSARVVEPRLTGGFAWSPYRGVPRSSGTSADPERMKLAGAAGELAERAQHDPAAEAQHGAGVAMVLTQNYDDAMARLEAAASTSPSAQIWSDLAAARYAAAADQGRAALYPRALAAADEALRLDPRLGEALFNRALILERMGLVDDARRAWTRYLETDASSKWAEEARTRLAELPEVRKSSRFEQDRPSIEEAAFRGDATGVHALLAEHAARACAFAEAEYLGRWGEAALQKQDGERWLRIARAIGAAIEGKDTLLRDAVRAIDGASPMQRDAIAAAHAAYRDGRLAYSRQQFDAAGGELARAAELFARAGSPMELAARYYAASVHFAQHDPRAGAELERVLAAVDAHPDYRSLRAHVRWELGRARVRDYDQSRAVAILAESAEMFRETGDRTNEAFIEAMLATALAAEGRGDDAWSSRIDALRALSAEGNPARLAAAVNGAVRADLLAGRTDAALAMARLPQPVAGDAEQLSLVLDALHYESMLESQNGSSRDALRTAERAASLAQGIGDASLRARRLADADVAAGAALAASDPAGAIAPLTRAIDVYRRENLPISLPEPLLLRARCAMRTGDATAAARDLEDGMQIVERHRTGAIVPDILDADRALFAEAIRLRLDRGDEAAAFALAERSRGAAITAAELQERLAGSATAVVEIALLPSELVTFGVTEDALRVARRRTDAAALAQLADASLTESGTTAAAALYDELLQTMEPVLARVQSVIVVADPRLEHVPFAALYDRRRNLHLVERVRVATASSAASLQHGGVRAAASLVTMTLPTGGATGTAALAQTGAEATDIGSLYPQVRSIASEEATLSALQDALADADVVHVAGHTERQPAGGEHALLLTGSDGVERASSRTLAELPRPRAGLLILAACETLRAPASPETRALSLGAAFAAAGVADVIGTLTPIGDRDARSLFRELHRHLASGEGAGDALRAAQIAAIRRNETAWRSVALLTRCIESPKGTRAL